MASATGGVWDHSFFFTALERERIAHAETQVDTRPVSFVTRLFYPLWLFISTKLVSETVAPNAITFAGLLSAIQSYHVISQYYHVTEVPSATMAQTDTRARTQMIATFISCVLLIVSIACGSVDGVHAKRCRSATPLGDIFARIASSFSRIFFALTLLKVMNVTDIYVRWYVLLTLQLIEFSTVLGRINAENIQKKRQKIKNLAFFLSYCLRDSELSFILFATLVLRLFIPESAFFFITDPIATRNIYISLVALSFALVALLKMRRKYKYAIALCLAVRVVPLMQFLLPLNEYSDLTIITDAVVVALLSIEVYVSFLAQRRINAAVIFICVGSLFNTVLALGLSIFYLIGMISDLSYSTRIPLFVPVKNVFIDGVFDLCHVGHKKVMENALKHGNRLIVGVCGDEDCVSYKRRPIMTTEERVKEVEMCKYVSRVIPNSPIDGISEEFIRRHNIHVVVCGQEYDKPDDKYYAEPRRLGILKIAPRTSGISTSVLIARIRAATDDDVVAKDKKEGRSAVQENE